MSSAAVSVMVRICSEHNLEVEESGDDMLCPRGWHKVTRWGTLNKRSGRVMYEAEADEVRAVSPKSKPLVIVKPEPQPAVVEGGARKRLRSTLLVDGAGAVLRIWLEQSRRADGRLAYSVGWTRRSGGAVVKPSEPLAVKAFLEEVAHAQSEGWQQRRVATRSPRLATGKRS